MSCPCFGFRTLYVQGDYLYEMYEPHDEIPISVLDEGLAMYYNTFLDPKFHEGFSLQDLGIDSKRFSSYEEFIADMFKRDFESYRICSGIPRFFLQSRRIHDSRIVGICAILEIAPQNYYIDHFGVDLDHKRQKIGSTMMSGFVQNYTFKKISLDTRVFNQPAQLFYEKLGFKKLEPHPLPSKQNIYFHYFLDSPLDFVLSNK